MSADVPGDASSGSVAPESDAALPGVGGRFALSERASFWVTLALTGLGFAGATQGLWRVAAVPLTLASVAAFAAGLNGRRVARVVYFAASGVLAVALAYSVLSAAASDDEAEPPQPPVPPVTASPSPSLTPAPSQTPTPGVSIPAGGQPLSAGWWPERDTYSVDARSSAVSLNSLVDSDFGFEPDFMRAKLADDPDATWSERIVAQPGQVYVVEVYFANSADQAAATGVRARLDVPGVVTGQGVAYAHLSASNASPGEVGAGVVIATKNPTDQVAVRYVSDSAVIRSAGAIDGTALDESLFGDGVLVGCDQPDGVLPAGSACAGRVEFKVRIDQPSFDVKVVAKGLNEPASAYSGSVALDSDTALQVLVSYQNTGTVQQDNVSMRVELPAWLRYVPGSTQIANSTTGGRFEGTSDGLTSVGYNVGSFQPGGNVAVRFTVMVDDPTAGGAASLWVPVRQFVHVTTNAGVKTADLTVMRSPDDEQ